MLKATRKIKKTMNTKTQNNENNHIAANPGDYIVGNLNMERILARLFEEETEDHGPPPMEPEDIENIATTMVDQEVLEKSSTCPVCLDTFQLREEVNILGCGHLYHAYCIKHWMGMHASCPVCRRGEGGREGGEGGEV